MLSQRHLRILGPIFPRRFLRIPKVRWVDVMGGGLKIRRAVGGVMPHMMPI